MFTSKGIFQGLSLHKIKLMSGLQVSKDFIHRRIRYSLHLIFKKIAKKPALTARHKNKQLEWANVIRHSITFSDEKKRYLDEPDGSIYYWHDFRIELKTFFKNL